jgi:hypothetical protein
LNLFSKYSALVVTWRRDITFLRIWFAVQIRHVEHSWKQLLLFGQQRYPNLPSSLNPQLLQVDGVLFDLVTILK